MHSHALRGKDINLTSSLYSFMEICFVLAYRLIRWTFELMWWAELHTYIAQLYRPVTQQRPGRVSYIDRDSERGRERERERKKERERERERGRERK